MAASSGSSALLARSFVPTQDRTTKAKGGPDPGRSLPIPTVAERTPRAFQHLCTAHQRRRPAKWADLAAGPLQATDGPLRLTWSLTPHSPAAALTDRRWRHPACRRITQHLRACPLCTVSLGDRRPVRQWAGLTPKPHHARQQRVALRGSFRLRLASTCNHRPAEVQPQSMAR
jgi:hypothetical protein